MDEVRSIAVVIPARDEEASIARAVASVQVAAAGVGDRVRVDTIVVANGCSDDTAGAARRAGAHVLVHPRPGVGAARAAGADWACLRSTDPRSLWLASTDADSVVPRDWLRAQLSHAAAGVDLVLGTITMAARDLVVHDHWRRAYEVRLAGGSHGHVHGANLGIRGTTYTVAGGFRAMAVHEDVDLVRRAIDTGAVAAWVDDLAVTTSARHRSRVDGGVASDLAASWAAGCASA
ncbi:glycosyltransferase [Aeromicrobium stalagmiti]|uniref:glycosyltransferase n=1 Tax=Aeromicrobium stalagmiti TaxID=2738988 RepID=UPI0015683965|nr:glycosyltransferase family 2 protein [Aeromicrobium stalagmiti]